MRFTTVPLTAPKYIFQLNNRFVVEVVSSQLDVNAVAATRREFDLL
jgi:hypothetical protein